MSSFEQIYVKKCKELKEEPVHIDMYKLLDSTWSWIQDHKDREFLLKSLADDRVYIALSADLIADMYPSLPKGFYDIKDDIFDQPLYASTPGLDSYRIQIIKRLSKGLDDTVCDKIFCLRWLIRRIEKVANMGWKEFEKQYK